MKYLLSSVHDLSKYNLRLLGVVLLGCVVVRRRHRIGTDTVSRCVSES